LRSQNQTIGVLSVQNYQPYAFSDRDIQFLSTLANQLAVALENARLFHEREQRLAELDVINRIGHITNSTLDIEQILAHVYEDLAVFLPVNPFFAFVYHSGRREIVLKLLVDEGQRSFVYEATPVDRYSLTKWIIGNRQPLLFQDLRIEGPARGLG